MCVGVYIQLQVRNPINYGETLKSWLLPKLGRSGKQWMVKVKGELE